MWFHKGTVVFLWVKGNIFVFSKFNFILYLHFLSLKKTLLNLKVMRTQSQSGFRISSALSETSSRLLRNTKVWTFLFKAGMVFTHSSEVET